MPTTPPSPKKQHSLLVLPSVTGHSIFAPEFFEMFTKKQSEHPQKVFQVFQVFRVFQVFHFAFGPQNRPFLVQIRTNPKNRYSPTSAIKWVRKTPKKAIHPLVYIHNPVRQAIGAFFFGGADFFFAERLFFRYGEGCEGRASRANVAGEWGYNGENSFSTFIPIRLPTIGRQPSHPHRSGFFIRFMPHESPPVGVFRHNRFRPASYSRSCYFAKADLFSLHATKAGMHRRF